MNLSRKALYDILARPDRVQVYSFGCDKTTGFGADYLGMLNRLMLSLQYGLGFRLTRITRPGGFVTQSGWQDYFQPFCDEIAFPLAESMNPRQLPYARKLPFLRYLNTALLRLCSGGKVHYFSFSKLEFTEDVRPPVFDAGDDYLTARSLLMKLLWVYNDQTRKEIEKIKSALMLPDRYVSVSIRRGDKNTEHPYVPAEQFAEHITKLDCASCPVFVATDDFRVYEELAALLPEHELLTLSSQNEQGYVHADFRKLPSRERRNRTLLFLVTLEYLWNAEFYVGSKTTNVSWMVNAYRAGRDMVWVD